MSQESTDLIEDSLLQYQNPPILPTNDTVESPPIRAEGGRHATIVATEAH